MMLLYNSSEFSFKKIDGVDLLVTIDLKGKKLLEWASFNKDAIEQWLENKGALILRGLNLSSSQQFGKLLRTLFDSDLLCYNNRSTPRTELRGNIYTATEYHSEQLIAQHNEQAYTNSWPTKIGFFCMLPGESGGETPIADSREIYKRIPIEIRKKFEDKGVLYVRNFSEIDLSWQEVFCTEDREEVEDYCNKNNIKFEWLNDGELRTTQQLPAVQKHPVTGELLWFNQAHIFHPATLSKEIRESLLAAKSKERLPRNTYYGDGSEIDDETILTILEVYQKYKLSSVWQAGDVMLLDNMLYSHGREPFKGERRVLVGMA
jgi:alpha-ketoglutarate-dependent taurine dioxygenase